MSENLLSKETIEKSLKILGIEPENNGDITKGDVADGGSTEDNDVDITKGEGSEVKNDEESEDEKMEKSLQKDVEDMEKALNEKKGQLEEIKKKNSKNPSDPLMKGESDILQKSEVEDIVKSELIEVNQKLEATTNLLKNTLAENNELKKSLDSFNETLGKLNEVVVQIGNQSLGRKSVVTAKQIEKSFGNDFGSNDGKKTLSLSQSKQELESTLLDLSNIEKGEVNDFYANAAVLYNTSRTLDRATISDLFTKHNIKIVE